MLTILAVIALQASGPLDAAGVQCSYDRAAMLALGWRAFDQDMAGGWRKLNNAGCDAAAADLIRDWRAAHKAEDGILHWHEGQLRANVGQTLQAIALFEHARKSAEEDAGFGWNLYVDGSIAFLRGDRPALEVARTALAALPRPAGFNPTGPDGKPIAVRWPINLNVLDGFRRCWGQPYKQACACPAPASETEAAAPR